MLAQTSRPASEHDSNAITADYPGSPERAMCPRLEKRQRRAMLLETSSSRSNCSNGDNVQLRQLVQLSSQLRYAPSQSCPRLVGWLRHRAPVA